MSRYHKAKIRLIDTIDPNEMDRSFRKFAPDIGNDERRTHNVEGWDFMRNIDHVQRRHTPKQGAFECAYVKILGAKISGYRDELHGLGQ